MQVRAAQAMVRRTPSPATNVVGSRAPALVGEVLRSPGNSLDPETRRTMEERLGFDLSRVRVHADERAARSADAVGAVAYTVGADIVFGRGRYRPHSGGGRALHAHELTHVAQQWEVRGPATDVRIGPVDDAFEREATRVAAETSAASALAGSASLRLQRQQTPEKQATPPSAGSSSPPAPVGSTCIVGAACNPPVCGSSWEFAHRIATRAAGAERTRKQAEDQGKVVPKPNLRPATNVMRIVQMESPAKLFVISDIWTSPEERSASNIDCEGAQCVVMAESFEGEAGDYLAGATAIGEKKRARDEWLANLQRVLTHEVTHARYQVKRPEGIQAADEISLFELGELEAILSEVPVWYGYLLRLPESQEKPARIGRAWDMWIESCGEGLRGVIHKLRCLNPCDRVDKDVAAVASPRIAAWPEFVRSAFLAQVKDPAREGKAPSQRKLRWPRS
jgi:hypothetical protein